MKSTTFYDVMPCSPIEEDVSEERTRPLLRLEDLINKHSLAILLHDVKSKEILLWSLTLFWAQNYNLKKQIFCATILRNLFSVSILVNLYMYFVTQRRPVTVAERSKACTVFARSEAGIMVSNPT
jgi:hypothetical protein